MPMDPFLVLGLAPGATPAEIRRAYLKLAREHHPDKGGSAEKFKAVSQAYNALRGADQGSSGSSEDSDEDTEIAEFMRSMGFPDFRGFGPGRFSSAQNIFGSFFGSVRGPDVHATVQVSLNDVVRGGDFTVKYLRNTLQGSTRVAVEYSTKISLAPGFATGKPLLFPLRAVGDRVPPSDLIVSLELVPHPVYLRVGDSLDLATTVDLDLVESLTGFSREFQLLDSDETFCVECDSVVNCYETKRVEGYGMSLSDGRTGDLHLGFKIRFPRELSLESRTLVRQALAAESGTQSAPAHQPDH